MVRKIKTINDIVWSNKSQPLDLRKLTPLNKIPFILPKKFIELLQISDGGVVDYVGVGEIYSVNSSDSNQIMNEYFNPPEFFPKNLVAFGESGNGDRVCFDYRTDPKTDNPPVVYWFHDADIGEDVFFEANNFVEFIRMLKEPEDDEND